MSKKSSLIFKLDYLCEHLPDEYRPSISREIRQLKKLGILHYKLVGKKINSTYKITPINLKRYTRKGVILYLEGCLKLLQTEYSKITIDEDILSIINNSKS